MRKLPSVAIDERPRTRGRLVVRIFLGLILLVSSPLLYEVGKLCVANWRSVFGTYTTVETPILTTLSDSFGSTAYDCRTWFKGIFNRTPWRASYVIWFALFWTWALAMLLRRC